MQEPKFGHEQGFQLAFIAVEVPDWEYDGEWLSNPKEGQSTEAQVEHPQTARASRAGVSLPQDRA